MSADLLTDSLQHSLGDSSSGGGGFLCDEPTTEDAAGAPAGCTDGMGGDAADFVGLSVGDFDLGEEMQLDGFPIDLWPGAIESNLAEESLGMCQP